MKVINDQFIVVQNFEKSYGMFELDRVHFFLNN